MAERHLAKIDFLRGIAILMVFLFHAQLVLFPGSHELGYTAEGIMRGSSRDKLIRFSPTAFGWSGVQLFLLISGYLIHRNFIKNSCVFEAGTYFSKRFWRIYPPYIITLLGIILVIGELRNYIITPLGSRDLFYHIFMVHNLKEAYIYGINPSLWSLALEVQLYLLYPLFLLVRIKWGITTAFFTSFIIAIFLLVAENYFTKGQYYNSYYFSAGALWYNWCAGALISEIHYNKKLAFKGNAGKISILTIALFWGTRFFYVHYYVMLFLAILFWASFLEWYMARTTIEKYGSFGKSVIALGICSYSFYLIHQPLTHEIFRIYKNLSQQLNMEYLFVFGIIFMIISFFIILVVSKFLYRYVELPSIRLGARLRSEKRNVK